jgi:hypothetical protein
MADWSLPALTSTYTNTLTEIKNRDIDLALQFDGTTSTSIPTGAIRWASSANTWQRWTGSAWGALSSTFAFPAITTTGAASIGTTLSVTGAATLSGGGTTTTSATDNNSTSIASTAFVLGQASATSPLVNGTVAVGSSFRYARQDHVHPTDTTRAPLNSPTFTGSVTIPSGASIAGYLTAATAAATYPTQTGGSASGTWGINITGSASSAATATTASSCSGNAASATTASSCSGNAATANALSTTSGSAPSYSARAWVNFNGTGTVAIRSSGNVSSITDNGVGDYTVNFSTAMPDANYAVAATSEATKGGSAICKINSATYSVNAVGIYNGGANVGVDPSITCVTILR